MQNFVTGKLDDFSLTFTFTEDTDPIDITEWDITLVLKRRREQTLPDKTVNGTLSDPENGEAIIEIPADEAELLDGAYFYDVHYVDDDGNEKSVIGGVITFVRSGGA